MGQEKDSFKFSVEIPSARIFGQFYLILCILIFLAFKQLLKETKCFKGKTSRTLLCYKMEIFRDLIFKKGFQLLTACINLKWMYYRHKILQHFKVGKILYINAYLPINEHVLYMFGGKNSSIIISGNTYSI